jgi:hypothetical protein
LRTTNAVSLTSKRTRQGDGFAAFSITGDCRTIKNSSDAKLWGRLTLKQLILLKLASPSSVLRYNSPPNYLLFCSK